MEEASDAAQLITDAAASFVTPALEPALREALAPVFASAPPEEQRALLHQLLTTGDGWGYFPPCALARRVNLTLGHLTVLPSSRLIGAERLTALQGREVVYLANHLSFSDANLLAYLLEREGHSAACDRLCVLAGPKVFTDPFRRFSSLCFGAIKLPQSPTRASGEAVMPRREVARVAAATIAASMERLALGDHLLIFVEGARSRSAAMQPALGAVSRYLERPSTLLVPLGIVGSEQLVPIGEEHGHPTEVTIHIGAPIEAAQLWRAAEHKRGLLMHAVGAAIAQLLPPTYQGYYAATNQDAELMQARAALRDSSV